MSDGQLTTPWGPWVNSLTYRWDVNTLSYVVWDGTLQTGALTIGKVDQGAAGSSAWKVDGSGVTQPVSGTFFQTTQPVSVASLPLPSNAALETGGNLATLVTNTTSIATAARQDTGNTSLATLVTNTTNIATSAKQDTGNTSLATLVSQTDGIETSLASVDSKTPALGQALAAGAVPVVLTAIQLAALTPATSVAITSIVPGTSATSLGKAEDSMAADGDTGVAVLSMRQDVPGLSMPTTSSGDYQFVVTDAQGRLWITSDTLSLILQAQQDVQTQLLTETRLMRQAFQDWSGTQPRLDPTTTSFRIN